MPALAIPHNHYHPASLILRIVCEICSVCMVSSCDCWDLEWDFLHTVQAASPRIIPSKCSSEHLQVFKTMLSYTFARPMSKFKLSLASANPYWSLISKKSFVCVQRQSGLYGTRGSLPSLLEIMMTCWGRIREQFMHSRVAFKDRFPRDPSVLALQELSKSLLQDYRPTIL